MLVPMPITAGDIFGSGVQLGLVAAAAGDTAGHIVTLGDANRNSFGGEECVVDFFVDNYHYERDRVSNIFTPAMNRWHPLYTYSAGWNIGGDEAREFFGCAGILLNTL
ncbi:hypothetical protein PEBR_35620 [Penicillium brasilianum]|uniref:Uncharacterized protein n=1 Tax=Penicillium brasilianum TaxID=104259 RepID=A0A1S9RE88_PENBI|nr:hypothetical protein PEBR_35620 [Penicillium brasilianum]